MNLFQILSHDERIIVLSEEGADVFYTWNQSLTLQKWRSVGDTWEEEDIRTLSDTPADYHAAREAALRWHTRCDDINPLPWRE